MVNLLLINNLLILDAKQLNKIMKLYYVYTLKASSFKLRVMVSGELTFFESYGKCDVTNTETLLLWRHKTISHYDFW